MIITKDQLKGLLDYYDMYGVESMEFELEKFPETIKNFGTSEIKTAYEPPQGRNISFSTEYKK